ncbi:MAG: hypothetical protein KDJ15_07735, partial [Alphaproteobacteria bacterium]|nr:hypothetical protein [Alphaproteobacteria bacterium]
MSDEQDIPSEDEQVAAMMGAAGDGGVDGSNGMVLNEIESADTGEDETEYAIGEAMASDVTAIYEIPVQISAVLG